MARQPTTVVFDLGNVLIDWSPGYLYSKIFPDAPATRDWFLDTVCTAAWNIEQDRGRAFAEAVAELRDAYPEWRAEIEAYHHRWAETAPRAIAGPPEIHARLRSLGVPLYALTNFAREKLDQSRSRFAFLDEFLGIIVSSDERLVKPDAAIFRVLLERYALTPEECVFIDDSAANVATARGLGFHAIQFESADHLRAALRQAGFDV